MKPAKPVRCAIYTRVSTDQGLKQDFNSLDAQYDASQAYIRSQAHAGWTLLRAKYDDGGFSGGNTDRPALQRLLGAVEELWNYPQGGRFFIEGANPMPHTQPGKETEKRKDELDKKLDDQLEETFPTSDPPSLSQPKSNKPDGDPNKGKR
jgi:hypothetical protein